jgi:galactokinase
MPDARSLFRRHFGCPPVHTVRAPGVAELLGSHAEDTEGLALAVAVDQYAEVAVAPRPDGRIELVTDAATAPDCFWLNELGHDPGAAWADGVRGTLAELRKRGVHFSGFNAAVCEDGFLARGLHRGGVEPVAMTLALRRLYPFSLTETGKPVSPGRDAKGGLLPLSQAEKLAFAKLCQAASAALGGAETGLLGPLASLFGKAWHVLNIDLRFLTVEPSPLIGEAIVFCDTRMPIPPAAAAAGARAHCQSAARELGAKALRSVELKFLEANRAKLDPGEYECARHVVADVQRVVAAERALREDDHRQLGQYMFQSYESSRDLLKNSAPEIELLVELARGHPGCRGARRAGGDFGCATVNLVAHHQAQDFMEQMSRRYAQRTGQQLQVVFCQVVDGAAS